MRAGSLRNTIDILDTNASQDPQTGQPIDDPDQAPVVLTCAAGIRAATSKEVYALGAGFDGQVTHAITIRYPATRPRSGMRIRFNGFPDEPVRIFRLHTCSDPDERRRELDLMCLELSK